MICQPGIVDSDPPWCAYHGRLFEDCIALEEQVLEEMHTVMKELIA